MPIDFDALKKHKQLDLGEYHEAYAGQSIDVWINPSRRVWVPFYDENIDTPVRVKAFYTAIWGIENDDYDLLLENAEMGLWTWMTEQSTAYINEYSDARKKVESG